MQSTVTFDEDPYSLKLLKRFKNVSYRERQIPIIRFFIENKEFIVDMNNKEICREEIYDTDNS